MTELQTFEGWTVDYRLEQFRKVHKDTSIEFVEFGSDKGDAILCKMIDKDVIDYTQWSP